MQTIYKKFRQFGIKKFTEKGSEDNCKEFHTNACRDSLRSKKCSRNDCRFYHIRGTKLVEKKGYFKKNPENQSFESRNRFAALADDNFHNEGASQSQAKNNCCQASQSQTQTEKKQVFQKEESPTDKKIEALAKQMDEIHSWMRKQNQTQNENRRSNNVNWRKKQERQQASQYQSEEDW